MKLKFLAISLAIPLLAIAGPISSGAVTVPGTFSFDFDAGVVDNFTIDAGADVFWEQFTATTRAVVAVNGATIANIGVVSFAGVTLAQLEGLSYGTTQIDGSDLSNVLVAGDVFAIHTNAGNFAKVLVTGAFDLGLNNGLPIQWETDSASVPEPGSFLLGLTGVAALSLSRRSLVKS